jgi:hypothetical protein
MVLARLDQAGIATDPNEGGFVARDPWENALKVVSR